ncbi:MULTISPECIES: TetR/AcrR family transcriptional regulator [unclassified Geodermatophilus]
MSAARETGQRETYLAGAVDHVLREGVATLSLRPLAAALGTSDRMLLYYFGTRENLLSAVLDEVGRQLQAGLAAALPGDAVPPGRLLPVLWTSLQDSGADAHVRLYLEVSGLAARGRQPFADLARRVAEDWLAWVGPRLDVADAERAAAAAGLLAALDGVLLVHAVAGPERAAAAAGWLAGRLAGP